MGYATMNALGCVGVVRWSGIVPLLFPSGLWMLRSKKKKMCTIKGVCMQPCLRAKDVCCEVLWVFSGYADYFLKVCDIPIYIYTLFSTVLNGGFQINGSLLNPAESCSNLKECLNKICTLPAVSHLVYQANEFCFYVLTNSPSQQRDSVQRS